MQSLQLPREELQLSACPDCGRIDAATTDRRQFFDFWDEGRRERFLITHDHQCKCGCDFSRDVWTTQGTANEDLL